MAKQATPQATNPFEGNPNVMQLRPYKWHGQWVFDDPAANLQREAFVGGADHVMDFLTRGFAKSAAKGFLLTFSHMPFEGHQVTLRWLHGNQDNSTVIPTHQQQVSLADEALARGPLADALDDDDISPWTGRIGHTFGNTYFCEEMNGQAWLCPALFKYFPQAPPMLFGRADIIPGGVTPTPMPSIPAYRPTVFSPNRRTPLGRRNHEFNNYAHGWSGL